MKFIKLISIVLLLQACSEQSDVAPMTADTDHQTYTAEDFYKTISIGGSSINHDGTAVLISSDETGIYNAYRMPLDGSPAEQLTNSTVESTYAISWFPGDDRILYFADQGGNENDHVYVRELNGSSKDLTPGENVKAIFAEWSDDDQSFYIMTNERDPRYYDIYKYQVSDYSRELIFENNDGYSPQGITGDGRWIALRLEYNNTDSDVFLIDLASEDQAPINATAHEGEVDHSIYDFTADNSKLIYATNEFGEYNQAWSYDLESGERALHFKNDNWDVSFLYFSDDGKYQVAGVNEDASTKVTITDTESGADVIMPPLPAGDLRSVNFTDDSRKMVFYINSDTSPSNLYVHEIGTDTATRLTNSGNPDIDENILVPSEVVRFKSYDGLEIPGLLYKPKQASATNKVPAIVYVHGGPGGQSRKGYNPTVQHLVNNGYAVMRINNRGSSGYGKTFYHMDDKKHGDVDLKDVVYNKYYLQSLDWVDADKIGVMGGSYGGYMVMAAMAFTDEFNVGVNIFGVTNWVRTLKSIPAHWEAARKGLYDELGDPETDEERLHNISPVFFGHQVKSPVLVVQGSNDPRVLQIESDDMVAAIREGGTYVDYLIFDDEGHGFSKRDNRIEASNKYLEFLDGYLK
ncbi:alpha/beta hydrolase family protein [Pseudemcibacter aquimaris]|uniref:S9 family peptidase n=1 Tax=Pseudemcibacter aquimaris TaxID=2857064 RepID=UPI002011A147|nr:S9 family peptidase [Pseudemcibacter aquimaris]MCC3859938.1 S9 family peptidase [Pseudemcibacter aquimaris]WDU57270.1 S9 family peptidase [Pseudemcibacter aquimaris]